MPYEPAYERFETAGPDRTRVVAEFHKSGFLAAGDRPELYFFRIGEGDVIVGISGEALLVLQRAHRYLSREEKIDVAGLCLKKRIEAGLPLTAENLSIRQPDLDLLIKELGIVL